MQGWAINIIVAGVHAAYPSAKSQEPQALRQLKPSQVRHPVQRLGRVEACTAAELTVPPLLKCSGLA